MTRALGVDLGGKRIGIAVCDAGRVLASPLCVIERSGSPANDHQRIAALVTEEEVGVVVVGLPVDLSGNLAIAADHVLTEVADMATVMPVPVETYDERMTTAAARTAMQGVAGSRKPGRARSAAGSRKSLKQKIDAAAAAVMLQGWLDSRS